MPLVMFQYFLHTFICIALLLFESGQCFFKGIFGQCFLISLMLAGLCFFPTVPFMFIYTLAENVVTISLQTQKLC